jgi:hypothetical protein
MYKVFYIDDDQSQLDEWSTFFGNQSSFSENFKLCPQLAQTLTPEFKDLKCDEPDLILIDQDLTKPLDGTVIPIKGVALSTALRERFQERPIVLFTNKSVFDMKTYSNIRQVLSSLDGQIFKMDVREDPERYFNFLIGLAKGYRNLRDCSEHSWKGLIRLMDAPADTSDLEQTYPPSIRNWPIFEIANWIRNVIMRYPGILYDPLYSATFLGITEEEFMSESVRSQFSRAKYSGIFCPFDGLWWRSRLIQCASSIIEKDKRSHPIRKVFPEAWESKKETTLTRSKCIFSAESPADDVCCILRKPMMAKYSLAYRIDSRPVIMDESKVSYEAIRTSNDIDDELFDPIGKDMLPEIRRMKITRREG